MNTNIVLSIAFLLPCFTTYANDLDLTEDQLNSILKAEIASPVVKKSATSHKENATTSLAKYVEKSIRNIRPMITGGYIGNLEKEKESAYPKALKEIKSDCESLSLRASDMNKKKMNSRELKNLRKEVSNTCYREVLQAFKQDIPKVKEYLKLEKQ